MPAHMSHHGAQGLTHPQPAHTQMHQHHPAAVLSGPQAQSSQITPHPSASPVQHIGPNGHNTSGPQTHHGHTQGVPPTSGTPQPSMNYGQQIGIPGHPPLQPAHAHSAHSHAGHAANHQSLHQVSMSYLPHTLQVNLVRILSNKEYNFEIIS